MLASAPEEGQIGKLGGWGGRRAQGAGRRAGGFLIAFVIAIRFCVAGILPLAGRPGSFTTEGIKRTLPQIPSVVPSFFCPESNNDDNGG